MKTALTNTMKRIISMLTMKLTTSVGFRDVVSGEQVYYYKDRYGVEWMSAYPYYPFNFRIKITNFKKGRFSKIDI